MASRILAIDTSFSACSAAVFVGAGRDWAVRGDCLIEPPARHAEALALLVGKVLQQAELSAARLDGVVVTVGPGGFTSVRTGVAFARGLGLAVGVPLYGISSLWLLALPVLTGGVACQAVAIMNAGREQFYVQAVAGDGRSLSEPLLAGAGDVRQLIADCGSDVRLAGNAAEHFDSGAGADGAAAGHASFPVARHLGSFVEVAIADARPVRPLYLRPPDARPPSSPPLERLV